MGTIRASSPVRLVVGFIFRDESVFLKARALLKSRFGGIDFESPALPFTHTRYYEKEFGADLLRRFISFRKPVDPADIVKIKVFTNKIESRLAQGGARRINIDPGYLDAAKLVLASTKDYRHRIYLNKGIYAEITLFYQAGSFRAWEWTYPDYATEGYIGIFNQLRELYVRAVQGDK